MKNLLVIGAIVAAIVLGGSTVASAAEPASISSPKTAQVSPDSLCSGSLTVWKTTSSGYVFQQASGANSAVTGSAGVTLSISTSTTFTVSGSITATTGITVSDVVASVKADVGVTIGTSKSGTTSTSGAWTVPADYSIGKLQIGTLKYSGTVTKYLENSNCVDVYQASTSYNAPQQSWHFQTSKVA